MHIYSAEEADAVDNDFWCIYRKVIRVDGAVLDLQVMPAKKAKAADTDTKSFWNVDVGASKKPHGIDGSGAIAQRRPFKVNVYATKNA